MQVIEVTVTPPPPIEITVAPPSPLQVTVAPTGLQGVQGPVGPVGPPGPTPAAATLVSTLSSAARPATERDCGQSTSSRPEALVVSSATRVCARVRTARSRVARQKGAVNTAAPQADS